MTNSKLFDKNTGKVVAGVIGQRKFSYDLWGDVVNMQVGWNHLERNMKYKFQNLHIIKSRMILFAVPGVWFQSKVKVN